MIIYIGDNMNLFNYIVDRLFYILVYLLSISLVVYIMGLGSGFNIRNILYALLISGLLLLAFLSIDYLSKRKVYRAVNRGLESDGFYYISNMPARTNREHKAFKELLSRAHRKYEYLLDKYREEYKSYLDLKNKWINNMNTSIADIKLYLKNNGDTKNYENIEEEIEKLSRSLEMDLCFLRIMGIKLDLQMEKINIEDMVREVIDENKDALVTNSIHPTIKSKGNLLVKSNKYWLKFIISQVISNSIKYTKIKDVEKKYIHISIYREEERSVLSIEDNGIGIANKDLDKVFNPFFTGEKGRDYKSIGMGLYLVREVCDRLGHGLELRSMEGIGTIVRILFYD